VRNWVGLKFAAMNLKKLAVWGWNNPLQRAFFSFGNIFNYFPLLRQGLL
jgi:hypothetical protein